MQVELGVHAYGQRLELIQPEDIRNVGSLSNLDEECRGLNNQEENSWGNM
jgi:hypothetical protein